MKLTRRAFIGGVTAAGLSWAQSPRSGAMKYVRYVQKGRTSYGLLEGETIKEIRGGLFGERAETGNKVALASAKLLYPCEPGKVLAVGLNYKSHIGDRPAPKNPEIFFKATSSLLEP